MVQWSAAEDRHWLKRDWSRWQKSQEWMESSSGGIFVSPGFDVGIDQRRLFWRRSENFWRRGHQRQKKIRSHWITSDLHFSSFECWWRFWQNCERRISAGDKFSLLKIEKNDVSIIGVINNQLGICYHNLKKSKLAIGYFKNVLIEL